MSPRPAPTRHDATALRFLNAAAALIDAALSDSDENLPPRLRQIHFPAALDWVRTEDVLRMAGTDGAEGDSRKAFRNRWPAKEDFVRDAIVHTMLYRDREGTSTAQTRARVLAIASESPTAPEFVWQLTAEAEAELLASHPDLHTPLRDMMRADADYWLVFYTDVLESTGHRMREGWTPERATWAMQALLDGVVLRHRIDPERMADQRWASGNMFADTVLAFCAGIIDFDGSGLPVKDWLENQIARPSKG